MQERLVITRFAPSPTGYLHIGGLRTALYNYLYAKKRKGKFFLRIEDTDLKRNSQEATQAILEAFQWCGLNYDDEPLYQSNRFELYKHYITKLLNEGKAYYCYMSKQELDELRAEQEAAKERPRYDGRYRDFTGIPPSTEAVVRIKAPQSGQICFEDGIKGKVQFQVNDILDDFIIARSDGSATYNFTVVIDDALMGVTDVIRGDDHLSNTPKQIVLYEALGFTIPKFYHLAMIHGEDGKKLSKRHGATDVMEYKAMGIVPEALLNFLVRLGWSHGNDEIFSLDELEKIFDPSHISKSASAYSFKKLQWLNIHYIKTLSFEQLNKHVKTFGFDFTLVKNGEFLLNILRERAKTIPQLISSAKALIEEPKEYDEKAVQKFGTLDNLQYLDTFARELSMQSNAKEFEEFTYSFLQKNAIELKNLAQVLRIALIGGTISPSIFEVLEFLGVAECKKRIEKFIYKEKK
ncbi:glutamate--tRNA ligase [Campylobacter sp. MIT 21-1685]|uniref:glutamate--tRNA ligase n=1 Tax=unclassified Campylobacter TaxID=2593542 RepID=UPI00224B7002|nr:MULTISPECIES: glutamate--tRNA ligase [unclassified Campylobacter]MCX2683186.1 glutamate--tRNA ligase [Campylobacter sp. MIT 21-1684]MCX2751494.1 glutamate--tRNA ligase [Campylobacter sp. MIT 21-1682]MCX2807667.1 glutamate--tRNA ligase [Campylobacter sp. MIT 21-1685]